MLEKREAYWTYDETVRAYYFAPTTAARPPYRKQVHVTAVLDIAGDGTLAGVELVDGDLPPPCSVAADDADKRLGFRVMCDVSEGLEIVHLASPIEGLTSMRVAAHTAGEAAEGLKAAIKSVRPESAQTVYFRQSPIIQPGDFGGVVASARFAFGKRISLCHAAGE